MDNESKDGMMSYFGFLIGAVALLCLVVIALVIMKHKSFKEESSRGADLKGVFFAIGFLPMLVMALSSIRSGSPFLTHLLAYIRNPFLTVEFAFDAFTGVSGFSFIMDFFTAVIFGSSVAITLAGGFASCHGEDHLSGRAHNPAVSYSSKETAPRETSASYLTFCRYLS